MATRAVPKPTKTPLRVVPKRSPADPVKDKVADEGSNTADLEAFHYHLGFIRRAQATVLSARKVLKEERRRASDAGVALGELDLVMKMAEEEPETVQATVNRIALYANWMGLAPGVQGDLFSVEKTNEEERAELQGYKEGIEGVTALGPRYDVTNPIGEARLKGWHRGQAVVLERFKPLEKPAAPVQEELPEGTTVQ